MKLKFMPAGVVADSTLNDRQIRVVANSGRVDRVGDVLVAKGCMLDDYLANNIVLANHDASVVVGNFLPEIKNDRIEGVLTFAPSGILPLADQYCALYKNSVMKTVSVGFNPITATPNKNGGITYERWELMELSCVAVPCDVGAVTLARDLNSKQTKKAAVWKVGASRNLPLGGDDAWDGPAAAASIFERAGFDDDDPDLGFARKGFLAYDSANPKLKGSYKLPFAKVIDGRLTAMPSGVRAAASRLPQTDIPEDVRDEARAVIDSYEAKMNGKSGRVLSQANQDHLTGLIGSLDKIANFHTRMEPHIEGAAWHAQAIRESAAGRRPADGDDYDQPGGEDEPDTELAGQIAHRKRLAAALALVEPPLTLEEEEAATRRRRVQALRLSECP